MKKQLNDKAAMYGINSLSDRECEQFIFGMDRKPNALQVQAMQRIVTAHNRVDNKLKSIQTSRDVYEIIKPYFEGYEVERFLVLALSNANKVLGVKVISEGGMRGVIVDPKVVFKYLLSIKRCTGVVLAHNHPSGTMRPSNEDRYLTQRVKDSAKLLDISLLDHTIYCDESYYSFADEGIL